MVLVVGVGLAGYSCVTFGFSVARGGELVTFVLFKLSVVVFVLWCVSLVWKLTWFWCALGDFVLRRVGYVCLLVVWMYVACLCMGCLRWSTLSFRVVVSLLDFCLR